MAQPWSSANAAASPVLAQEQGSLPEAPYYIVVLREPALASYRGDVPGLRAPARGNDQRLDASDPAARQYVDYLASRQQQFVNSLAARGLGNVPRLLDSYQHAINAVVLAADAGTMEAVAKLPDVLLVEAGRDYPVDTDAGPAFIGAPAIWDGPANTRGEGVVVGIIDTGVNFLSPSFAATDVLGNGHANPLGAGTYLGECAPGGVDVGSCNDKLIGAYDFVFAVCSQPSNPCGSPGAWTDEPSATDSNGHGTHTAGTAAGNLVDADVLDGTATVRISGVAPLANLVTYDVCYTVTSSGNGLCPTAASVGAINQAVADGVVDVLNFSIGGGSSPWGDAVSMAFLGAHDAGIVVAASAGNTSGNAAPGSTGHREPWTITVGASTHDRNGFGNLLSVTGPGTPPANVQDLLSHQGSGPLLAADMVDVPFAFHSANPEGCTAGGGVAGPYTGLVLLRRGTCGFLEKVNNAVGAGATGVIISNNAPTGTIVMGALETTTVPSAMVTQATGADLEAFLGANPTATATWTVNPVQPIPGQGDVMGAFSNRGPTTINLLKPDVTNPGLNILAPYAGAANSVAFLQGTSMSSPHTAGAAALVRAMHPDWTPMEIKSALMMSSNHSGITRPDGVTPSDPFDRGAGRVNLANAARVGLVMDESGANFLAANPASSGNPGTLNLPSFQSTSCVGACSFTRTVRSVSSQSVTYDASVVGLAGVAGTVTPASFTIAPGGSQEIEVAINVNGAASDTWQFARVDLVPQGGDPTLHMPVAVFAEQDDANMVVDPTAIVSAGEPGGAVVNEVLTLSNTSATVALDWNETNALVTLPVWNQAPTGTSGIVSDLFLGESPPTGAYTANDFTLTAETTITEIFTPGFDNSNTLGAQPAISWAIYADAGGVPAADPEVSPTPVIWQFDALMPNAAVDITGNSIRLDLAAASQSVVLQPGTYWLTVFPTYTGTLAAGSRWNWSQGTAIGAPPVGAASQLISPVLFGGVPAWTPLANLGLTWNDTAFTIEGQQDICGAPWLSINPTSGSVAAGGSQAVTVSLDPSALGAGVHEANVCLASNDPDSPVTIVPVTFNVIQPNTPIIQVSPGSLAGSTVAGGSDSEDLTIGNIGSGPLTWDIESAALRGAGGSYRYHGVRDVPMPELGSRATAASAKPVQGVERIEPINGGGPLSSLNEGFDSVPAIFTAGWAADNNSEPLGGSNWTQMLTALSPAHSGAANSATVVNFNSAADPAPSIISNWLMTPEMVIQNGTEMTFFARASDAGFPDRLQIRLSTAGASTNVGSTATDVGDFTTLLLDINPTYADGVFVNAWTQYTVTVSGLGAATSGRFAFRYFVEDGGPSGSNSDIIAVDTVSISQPGAPAVCDAPSAVDWLTLTPASGTTAAGGSSTVVVGFDATGLTPGGYTAQLCVNSDDPATPLVEVPVSFTVAIPPPSHDLVENARVIDANPYADTVPNLQAATLSAGDPTHSCAFNGPKTGNHTVWYSFTAPDDGTIDLDTLGSSGSMDDTLVSVFSGSPGSFTEVACNDDASGSEFLSALADVPVESGTTYTVYVSRWSNTATTIPGTLQFNFAFEADPPEAQTITFDPLADRLLSDSPFTVTATASSGLPVSFASSTPSVCEVDGSDVSLLALGTCTIVASQAGDDDWLPADDEEQSFEVLEVLVSIDPATLPRAQLDQAYMVQLTASGQGTTGPFTFAITDGGLPAGLTMDANGLIAGAPAEGGEFTFTVTATDSSGGTGPYSGSIEYTLEVVLDGIFSDGFEDD